MSTREHTDLAALGLPRKLHYTIAEVAPLLEVSPRWLADQCRDGAVAHVHIARKRRFTAEQVRRLLDQHTVTPLREQQLARQRNRVARLAARQARR